MCVPGLMKACSALCLKLQRGSRQVEDVLGGEIGGWGELSFRASGIQIF